MRYSASEPSRGRPDDTCGGIVPPPFPCEGATQSFRFARRKLFFPKRLWSWTCRRSFSESISTTLPRAPLRYICDFWVSPTTWTLSPTSIGSDSDPTSRLWTHSPGILRRLCPTIPNDRAFFVSATTTSYANGSLPLNAVLYKSTHSSFFPKSAQLSRYTCGMEPPPPGPKRFRPGIWSWKANDDSGGTPASLSSCLTMSSVTNTSLQVSFGYHSPLPSEPALNHISSTPGVPGKYAAPRSVPASVAFPIHHVSTAFLTAGLDMAVHIHSRTFKFVGCFV
mmetsp:Transcript_35801/g.69540  ORF Transcript_35801/g.69540 Transcript_35801/m.69540 type:complete len:280 (+) Transcript_35801:313-1152(+)